jgi:hypothetical protein
MIAMMKLSLDNRGKGSKRGTIHKCQHSITNLNHKEGTSTFEAENGNKRTFANVFLHDHEHQEVVQQQINQDQIVVSPCRRRKLATLCGDYRTDIRQQTANEQALVSHLRQLSMYGTAGSKKS